MSHIKRAYSWINKPKRVAYVFLAPTAILLLLFNILPLLASFFISMLDMKVSFTSAKFIGLENYIDAFGDKYFINSLKVTLTYTLVEVPLQMVIGLVFSAILTKNSFINRAFRAIYFLPIICSATAIGIMFKLVLNSQIGLVAYWLSLVGIENVKFLTNPDTALGTIIFIAIWKTFGISSIILIAAMQNVSRDYYEAASIDGAGHIRQFFSITIPCIKPSIWFLLMTRIIGSLQMFDLVYTLTKGGPNHTTESLVSYVFTSAFEHSKIGYATAMSEFLFIIIMILTTLQYWVMNKTKD